MIDAPTRLVGPDIALRPWRAGDEAELVDAWHDADVLRWTAPPAPADHRAAERWIDGAAARTAAGIAVDLVITAPPSDEAQGEVGLYAFDRRRRGAQVGYWVAAGSRGRGYAAAALDLVAEWVLVPDRLAVLVARCHGDNHYSKAVAAAAGFDLAGVDDDGYELFVRRSPTRC